MSSDDSLELILLRIVCHSGRSIERLWHSVGRFINGLCGCERNEGVLSERNEDLHWRRRFTSSDVHYLLSYLKRLENEWDFGPREKDDIHTFRIMISVLVLISEWQMKHHFFAVYFYHVDRVIQEVIEELQLFWLEFQLSMLSVDADVVSSSAMANLVRSNLEKLRIIKPDLKGLYYAVSRSSEPLATGSGEDALRFLNTLLENLNDLLCGKADLILLLRQQIGALENELKFLRCFLHFLSKICNWHEHVEVNLFVFAETVVINAACLLYFLLVDKMTGEGMIHETKFELFNLVNKIRPIKPEIREIYFRALEALKTVRIGPLVSDKYVLSFFDSLIDNLRELSNRNYYFEVDSQDQVEILLEELSLVRHYLIDTPLHYCEEGLNNLMTQLLDLLIDLGVFIFSYERLESMQQFGDLMDKIQFIKSASGYFLIPGSWKFNFPRTGELAFINFVMMNLKKRLNCKQSGDPFKREITIIYEELVVVKDDFFKIIELCVEDEGLRALIMHYKDVTYQVEYYIDLSLLGAVSLQYIRPSLTDIREHIRQIHVDVKAISKKMTTDNFARSIMNDLGLASSEAIPACIGRPVGSKGGTASNRSEATDQLVSLEDEARKIIDQLTGGPKQLTIISIAGMPGIGKTTLADFVYRDPSITAHFHAQAWCVVSHAYKRETLLLKMLHQVQRESKQNTRENVDSDQQLYQSLKGRRYLVILDDIWDINVWYQLKVSFPDDSNGSRLVFTSRNQEIAFRANSVPHNLQLLSDEDSWKLLQIKVFEKETCPPELFGIGKRIAVSCRGLPLAVVLIAGILKTAEGNVDCWERIGNELRSYVVQYPPGQQLGTLELSYIHLPDYLKPCFLYFGAFAEDAEIPVHKLVHLWMAEGFVQPPKVEQNSLEHEAENYLIALIERSLVMVAKRSSRGGVKTCCVHDILHEFCLLRAKEERFLLPISKSSKLPTFRISEMHEQYRLSVHSDSIPSVRMRKFVSRVRTLLFSSWSGKYGEMSMRKFSLPGSSSRPGGNDHLKCIVVLNKFRLLRVLDLLSVYFDDENVLITISQLVHLKYLAIQASVSKIPTEVANLKNMQTFLLRTTLSRTAVLAETIWSMLSLRHLLVEGYINFHFSIFQQFPKLENLITLSTPALYCDKNLNKMMHSFPNLRKLKCVFLDSWDSSKRCNFFPALDFMTRLESLKVSFSGEGLYPCNFSFPLFIKKLTLSKSRLPWDEISIIGRLPKLEVLKLLEGAFRGREWEMKGGEFRKLKFLKLHRLDIKLWNASSEQLPCLEQLVLEKCYSLEEIPYSFGEIPTLRMIDVKWCKPSVTDSVKQIEEEQHDMGNDQLKVFITGD